jgi:hypothetical protein
MKYIQVIDAATNCAYDVYQVSDENFKILFPEEGQDIQFEEDVPENSRTEWAFKEMQKGLIDKKKSKGIDGTYFYRLGFKKQYYPNKKESDLTALGGRPRDCGF